MQALSRCCRFWGCLCRLVCEYAWLMVSTQLLKEWISTFKILYYQYAKSCDERQLKWDDRWFQEVIQGAHTKARWSQWLSPFPVLLVHDYKHYSKCFQDLEVWYKHLVITTENMLGSSVKDGVWVFIIPLVEWGSSLSSRITYVCVICIPYTSWVTKGL